MEIPLLIIGLVAGLVAGYLIAAFSGKAKSAEVRGRLDARNEEAGQLNERIVQMNVRIDDLNSKLIEEGKLRAAAEAESKRVAELENENRELLGKYEAIATELATLKETIKKERESFIEQKKLLDEAKAKLEETFKALSIDALKSNSEEFIRLAKSTMETFQETAKGDLTERQTAIQNLVQPMRENLEKYQELIQSISKERTAQYTSLQDQVKSLLQSEESLKSETGKLVNALSAPQVRGNWGELTLRRVAELAGMVERCDFVEQESIDSERGRLRPDMIVNLPNNRRIVVDAKAPLKAYLEAHECVDDKERAAKLENFAKHVKGHINQLSRKEYWDQFDDAPEFVVLFLPGEQFLGAALAVEPGLQEIAFRQNIVLAQPATLVSLLKAVAYGWRQEALTENAKHISELGKELYERISTLVEHFEAVGKNLDRSIDAYNRAVGSLNTRVAVSARKFAELGISSPKEISDIGKIERVTREITPIGTELMPSEDNPSSIHPS